MSSTDDETVSINGASERVAGDSLVTFRSVGDYELQSMMLINMGSFTAT